MKFPRNGSGFLAVCLLFAVLESTTGQVIFEDDDPPPKPQLGRPSRPPPNGNFEDDDPTTRFFPLQNLQLGQLGQLGAQLGQQFTGLLGQFLNPQRPGGGGGGNGNGIGGACRTFEGDPGVCTRLNACQELVAILNNSPSRQAQRILRRSICGVTGLAPLVCCPSPTPGGGFPGPEQGGGFNGGNRPDNGFGGGRPGAGGQNPGKQPGEGGFQGGNRPGGEQPGGGGGFQGGNRPEGGNQNGGNQPGGGFQGGNRPEGGGFQGGNQPGGGGGFQGGNQPGGGGGFQGGNRPGGGGFQGGNRPVNPGGNEDFTFGGGNGGGGGFQGGNVSPQPVVTTPKPTTTTTSTTTTRPPTPATTTQPAGGGILPPGQGGFVKPGEVVPEFDGRGLKIPGTELPCGISNVSSVRVVGGKESPVGAWPWLTALGFREAESGGINFLCGGALVSQQHVLTAAHCVHERNDLELIRVGDHNLYSDKDGLTPVDVPIAQIIKHPNYDPKTFQNDIAVLKLKRKVDFTKYVQPICLPNTPEMRSQRFSNTIPFIAGWGALSFNGASSATLQQAQVPTIDSSICAEKYKQFKTSRIDDTNICAGFPTGRIDACQGDSGGPMMLPIKGGNPHIIIGVVSYGFRCAEPNFPGIYTRVTAFSDWIDNAITSTYDP